MNLWSWIFFPRSKVFKQSGHHPSSAGQVPRGRLRAICIFHARRVCNLYSLCAIFYVLRAGSVVFYVCKLCTICVLFVCNLCRICVSFCATRTHNVFVGPGCRRAKSPELGRGEVARGFTSCRTQTRQNTGAYQDSHTRQSE